MSNPVLAILGSLIVGFAVALLNTYPQYQSIVQDLQVALAISGFILTIYTLFRK